MSNVNEKKEKNEKLNLNEGINDFLQKNRKPIVVAAVVIVLLFIGCVAALSLADAFRKKAIAGVEELNVRYEALSGTITEEASAADVEALLADLNAFAKKNAGYAGGRAWAVIAGIRGGKKEWPEAETAWLSAARAAAKTYLAPLAYFNAGAAAEEQGKTAEAIEHYTQSLTVVQGRRGQAAFPAAPRAQFAIGRLRETLGEQPAAIEAYREIISKWSYDSVWTNLAHSRIIALESALPTAPVSASESAPASVPESAPASAPESAPVSAPESGAGEVTAESGE